MSRTRTQGNPQAITRIHEQRNYACSSTGWETVSSAVGIPMGRKVTMTDEVIPHFHKRVRNGEMFFNAMTRTESEFTISQTQNLHTRIKPQYCPNGNLHEYRWGDGLHINERAAVHGFGSVGAGNVISENDIANLCSEASTKLLSKRGRSTSNLWESLAEYQQAAGMLGGVAKRTNSFLTRKNVGAQVTDLAALWLTYRYGLRPAISDVLMIVKGLEKKTGNIRVTSRVTAQLSNSSTVVVPQVDMSGWGKLTYNIHKNDEVVVRAMSLDELIATRAYNIGMSGKDLLTTPWEVIPASFVWDWFFNVGDFLGAIVPTFQVNQLGSCLTILRTSSAVLQTQLFEPNLTNGWDNLEGISGTATRSDIVKTRVGLSNPKLLVKSDFGFDRFNRVADAFSLIATRLNKRFGHHGSKGEVGSFHHSLDFGALR